jgi:hypothetical protein
MTDNWRDAAFGSVLAILLSAAPLLRPCRTVVTAFAQRPETPNILQGEAVFTSVYGLIERG